MDTDGARGQLSAALEGMQESLRADGADLEMLGLEGTTARVRLVVGPETCMECIMPKEYLEELMLATVQETMPQVDRVDLEDPRGL